MTLTPSLSLALDPAAEAEVQRLASRIDVSSMVSIASFGQEIGERTAAYADALLSKARSSDLDEVGAKLNEIIAAAQAFDLTSLDNRWARAPVVGPIVRQFSRAKDKAMARFASVETQVDRMVANVESTSKRLTARSSDFEAMYAGVQAEHAALGLHACAGQRRLEQLVAEMATLRTRAAEDDAAREALQALEAARAALEKRVADLAVLQHSALQTLPMIRVMQANNLSLIEKFNTIQRLTLPAWKRTFLMALALNEQRDAGKLADNIDDATNYFMRRNAEVLHQNAVATAKSNQRLVIDVETLRAVHDEVISTLNDVRAVHAEGALMRAGALAELEDLRNKMSAGLHADAPLTRESHARLAAG